MFFRKEDQKPINEKFTFIVDFTWNPEKEQPLCLLEMGEFFKSKLTGLDYLRKEEEKPPIEEEYLEQLKKQYPSAIYLKDETVSDYFMSRRLVLYDFKENLQKSYIPKWPQTLVELLISRGEILPQDRSMRDMLVSLHGVKLSYKDQIRLEAAQKNQNHSHLLNFGSGGLWNACADKVIFYKLAQDCGLLPNTFLVNLKVPDEKAIGHFLENNPYCIIKPTNRTRGIGVCLVESKELVSFLFKKGKLKNEYWNSSDDLFMLVQAFCPSKPIMHKDRNYLPTGRLVIEATFTDPKEFPQLTFVGGYWKLPEVSSEDLSTKAVVSQVGGSSEPQVASISPEDWKNITARLQSQFASALKVMFSTSTQMLVNLFNKSEENVLKNYAKQVLKFELATPESKEEDLQQQSIFTDVSERYFSQLSYGSPGSMDCIENFKSAVCGLEHKQLGAERKQEASKRLS